MKKEKLSTFTFIVDFRGGKYCTQVLAEDVYKSVRAWTEKLKKEKKEIEYLGDKTIKELEIESRNNDFQPVQLDGLKNIWSTGYLTKMGNFTVNIVKTDVNQKS